MIKVVVVGDIGSGKTHIANLFGYPVFNADDEVAKIYKKNKKCYIKLKKKLPDYITSFPVKKNKLSEAIISNKNNIKKIVKIVHPEISKKMNIFINKNKNKKIIVLDIPLIIENKIYKKKDILIFVEAKKKQIEKRLRNRVGYNKKIIQQFKKLQLPVALKKKRSNFIIKNNFKNNSVKKDVKKIIKKILLNA
jgi:dephospho-CoA kinase